MDNGYYRVASRLFRLMFRGLSRYPKGNPPGEKEIPHRKEKLADMQLGEISCLFQMGDVRQGRQMLQGLDS